MTYTTDTYNLLEPVNISIGIQYHRVIIRLISKERAQRSQDSRTCPHTHPYNPLTVTRHLIARIINNIIDNKDKHGHHNRHSQTTLTDNSTQRGTDKKEYKTCHRKRQLLVPGRHVASKTGICLRDVKALETPIASRTFRTIHCSRDNLLFL